MPHTDFRVWNRTLCLPALLIAALAWSAPPPSSPDLYLVIDPSQESSLLHDVPGLRLEPLLPEPVLAKLGLMGWRRGHYILPVAEACSLLASHPAVQLVEPVPLQHTSAWQADDPGLRAQWHLASIGAEQAWQRRQGTAEVVVAIVDTGVDWAHEDLASRIWVNAAEDLNSDGLWTEADLNGMDEDQNGYVDDGIGWDLVNIAPDQLWPGEDGFPADNDPADFNGHGTHCAGDAAAAGFNGIGVASPAPRVRILPIRAGYTGTDGQGWVSHGLEGMLLAGAYGASVISMSFGGSGYSQIWQNAVNTLHAQNIVMVAAAGNENSSMPSFPAALTHMIAVGATNQQDQRAGFSNYGDWVDIGAPGTDILSTARGGGYATMSGTSMAAPVTAGAAALVKSVHPGWDGDQVLAQLAATADPLPGENLGAGRVHIGRALEEETWVEARGVAGSGRLQQGIPGNLLLTVYMGPQPIGEGVLYLSSNDARLPLAETGVNIGFLHPDSSRSVELELTYPGPGLAEIELTGRLMDGPLVLWEGMVPVPCGVTELLLLEQDSSDNWSLLPWYVQALSELGLEAEIQRQGSSASAAGSLPWDRVQQVLLFTGSDLSPTVAPDLEDSLRAFLARGGRVVMSGQQLAAALSPAFLAEVAGAQIAPQAAAGVQVWGLPEQDDVADLHLLLAGSGGAGNQTDAQVLLAAGGQPLFSWVAGNPSLAAGIRSADGRLDLLSFGLEAVNGDPAWAPSLSLVLDRLLGLGLDVPDAPLMPQELELACWPNPFNPILNIQVRGGSQDIFVHNLLGQQVAYLGRAEPGNALTWSPMGLAGGTYWIVGRNGENQQVRQVLLLP